MRRSRARRLWPSMAQAGAFWLWAAMTRCAARVTGTRRYTTCAEKPEPSNGAILRDSDGNPTGVLQEQEATSLVYNVIDRHDPMLTRHLVEAKLKELQGGGITSIHDIEDNEAFRLFQQLRNEGVLHTRVQMILPRHVLPELRAVGIQAGFGADIL